MHNIISNLDGAVDHGLMMGFAKTFDKVPYWRLIYKLKMACPPIYKWINSWLTGHITINKIPYMFVFSNSEIYFGIVLENSEKKNGAN